MVANDRAILMLWWWEWIDLGVWLETRTTHQWWASAYERNTVDMKLDISLFSRPPPPPPPLARSHTHMYTHAHMSVSSLPGLLMSPDLYSIVTLNEVNDLEPLSQFMMSSTLDCWVFPEEYVSSKQLLQPIRITCFHSLSLSLPSPPSLSPAPPPTFLHFLSLHTYVFTNVHTLATPHIHPLPISFSISVAIYRYTPWLVHRLLMQKHSRNEREWCGLSSLWVCPKITKFTRFSRLIRLCCLQAVQADNLKGWLRGGCGSLLEVDLWLEGCVQGTSDWSYYYCTLYTLCGRGQWQSLNCVGLCASS